MIADFENEIMGVCKKYEKDVPHASLVGVLIVVTRIYMDAQINNIDCAESCTTIKKNNASPKPVETEK